MSPPDWMGFQRPSDVDQTELDALTAIVALKAATAYVDAADGLLVPKGLVDAKGDLLVGTADNTVARKAVGSNGMSVIADSSQSDGLRWSYPRMGLQQRACMPAGAITEAGIGRFMPMGSQLVLTSGTLRVGAPMVLPKGATITSITIPAGSTGATSPTNQWFALVRYSDLAVLGKTADDGSTAWSASQNKTLVLATPYVAVDDELVAAAILVVAVTPPTIVGWSVNSNVTGVAPILGGNSTASLTNPASLGGSAAAVGSGSLLNHYAYVS